MKKIFLFFILTTAITFGQSNAIHFKAIIQNPNSDSLTIASDGFEKLIIAKPSGQFNGSFSAPNGLYKVKNGREYAWVYLKKGAAIQMALDGKYFDESLKFSGDLANENNFLAWKMLAKEAFEYNFGATRFNPEAGISALAERKVNFDLMLKDKKLDPDFIQTIKEFEASEMAFYTDYVAKVKEVNKLKGKPTPDFIYETPEGKKTSLKDFKGKYVLIDIWATWCGPCIQEMPHLKKLEAKFASKDIVFVGISVDVEKDIPAWKKMILKKQMGGVQLRADQSFDSPFMQTYFVDGIPRFILIDPNGIVIETQALPPSFKELEEQLDALLK